MSRTHRTPPTKKTTTTSRSRLSDASDSQIGMSENGLTYEGLARAHGAGTGVPHDRSDAPLTGAESVQAHGAGTGVPHDQGDASLTDAGLERTRGAGAGKQQAHSTETIASLWARDEGGRMMRVNQAGQEGMLENELTDGELAPPCGADAGKQQTQGDAQTSAEMLQIIGANTSQRTGATGVNQGRQEQQTQGDAQTSAEMPQSIGANTSQRARFAGVNLAQEEQVERITVKVIKVLTARQDKIDKRRDTELSKCMSHMEQMIARIEGSRRQDERPVRRDSDDGQLYRVALPGHPNDNHASSSAAAHGGVTQVDRPPRPGTDEELEVDGDGERGGVGFGFGDVERGGFGFEDLEREGVGNADRRDVVGSVEPQVDQGRRVVQRQPSGQDRAEEVQRCQSRRVLNGQPYGQDGMSSLNPNAPPFDFQYRRQHPPVDMQYRRRDPQFDIQGRRQDLLYDVQGRRRDPQFDNQGRRQRPPFDIQDRRQDPREMEREQDTFVGPETSQESDRSIRERWDPREWEEERGAGSYAPRRDTEPKFKNVLAKLQDFYGSKRDAVKWERWVERFDLHCEVANIGHAHYVKLLGEHLQGSAYEIYRGILRLEPRIRWTELQGKLKGHFQPEKNSALQVAEYNCAAWEHEDGESLNEFVTRLQGYMHEGIPDATVETKEMLIRVKFWESLPLRWKTQIETSSPRASLSEVVKLAIEIQLKEKADKGIHRITDALKRTFRERKGGQDFVPRSGGQGRFGTPGNLNFSSRDKPNFDKIQTGQDRSVYGNGGGSAQRSSRFDNYGRRRYNDNYGSRRYNDNYGSRPDNDNDARRPFNNNYGQRTVATSQRTDQRPDQRRGFTPRPRPQGGNLHGRANVGAVPAGRNGGQRIGPVVKRPAYRAPARGATQAAAYHHPARYAVAYGRNALKAPVKGCGSEPWERYLRSTVNAVAAGKADAPGRVRQAMKCPVWTLDVKVGRELANALFDTGSTISIISLEQFTKYADEIGPMEAARRVRKVTGTHRALSGHPLPFLGMIEVVITVGTDIGVVPCYILKDTLTALLLGDSFAEVFGVRCTVGSTSRQEWCVGPRGRTVKGAAGFRRSMGEGMMTVCHVARDTKVMAGCRSTVTCRAPAELMGKECMVQREIDKVPEEMFCPDSLVMMNRKGEFKVVADNFCPKTQLLRKRQDLGTIGRIVAHGNAKDGQTVGVVSQHCVLPEGQWSIPVQRKYPNGRAESMDEVKSGHELKDMETQRVTAPLDVFALEYGELDIVKDVRHDTPMTAGAQEVRQKLRSIPHGMVKQLKTGTEETVWRRDEVWTIRNAAKEVTAVRKEGLMVDQATPPTPQAKEGHKAGNIEGKAKGSQMSEDKSVEVDQNVTQVDVKVPETSYEWDQETGGQGGPSGREDARAWRSGLKENHRGVSRSWRGILEAQKYPGGDEANGGFRGVVRRETSPGIRTDSGITSRKVRSEREMFDGSNVKAALGDGAIHIAKILPAEHERLTQIVARMMNGPHVTDGRMVQTGRWSDAEQRVADLPDRASLPSRTTFTVKMKYHNDEGKNRDTSQTAMWASRRSTMKDGYGVENACDLTKIHEASTGRADDRASELIELIRDPKVDWIMVDISEGYGVPRRGRVECYQLLVGTRKWVKRTKWKNYRKAIEALAPRKWRDRWKKKSTIRVKEFGGTMVREGTRDDHIWRVVWVKEDEEVMYGTTPNSSARIGPVEVMMDREMVLKQGDLVYLRNPSLKSGPADKLKFEWKGPYEITSLEGANVYIRKCGKPGVDTKCGHLCKVSKLKLLVRSVEKGDEQVTEAPPEVRILRAWKRQARSRDGQNDDQTAQVSSLKKTTRPTQDAAAKRLVERPRKGTPLREAECPGAEVVVRRPVDRPRKVVQPRNVGCTEMEKRIGKTGDRSERRGGEDRPAREDRFERRGGEDRPAKRSRFERRGGQDRPAKRSRFERRGGEDRPAKRSRLECRGGEDRPANGSWPERRGGEDRPAERDGSEGRGGEDRPVRDTAQGMSKNKRADKINKEKDAFKALVVLGRDSDPSDMWSPHKAKTGYGERKWLKLAGGEGRGSERLKYKRTPRQRNADMDDQTPQDANEDEGEQVPRHLDAPTNDVKDEVNVVTVKEEEASSEVTGGGVRSEAGDQPRTLHVPVRGPRGPHREEEAGTHVTRRPLRRKGDRVKVPGPWEELLRECQLDEEMEVDTQEEDTGGAASGGSVQQAVQLLQQTPAKLEDVVETRTDQVGRRGGEDCPARRDGFKGRGGEDRPARGMGKGSDFRVKRTERARVRSQPKRCEEVRTEVFRQEERLSEPLKGVLSAEDAVESDVEQEMSDEVKEGQLLPNSSQEMDEEMSDEVTEGQLLSNSSQETDKETDDDVTEGQLRPDSSRVTLRSERTETWWSKVDTLKSVGAVRARKLGYAATVPIPEEMAGTEQQQKHNRQENVNPPEEKERSAGEPSTSRTSSTSRHAQDDKRRREDDDEREQIAAPPEMMSLLKDRNYRWIMTDDRAEEDLPVWIMTDDRAEEDLPVWIMTDDRAEEDLPVGGLTVLYQQLLRSWAGEGLCPVMVNTLEMLWNVEYQSDQDAIWALVPQPWMERWTQIADGMADRQSVVKERTGDLQMERMQRKLKEKDGQVMGITVEMVEYRRRGEGQLLPGLIRSDERRQTAESSRMDKGMKVVDGTMAITADTAEADEKVKGHAVQRRLMGAVWIEAGESAKRLRIARSRELGCADPNESVVWTVTESEEQARAMETLLAVQGVEDMSPVMIRELRWRLMTDMKRRYDGMTKAAIAPVWRSRSKLPVQRNARQQDKAFNVKPNVENEEGSAGRAVVTPEVQVEKEDRKLKADRRMLALHSRARQRGDDRRGVKDSELKETENRRRSLKDTTQF